MVDPTAHEPETFADLEQQVRQLLQDLGARPHRLVLTAPEQERVDQVAARALDQILGRTGGVRAEPAAGARSALAGDADRALPRTAAQAGGRSLSVQSSRFSAGREGLARALSSQSAGHQQVGARASLLSRRRVLAAAAVAAAVAGALPLSRLLCRDNPPGPTPALAPVPASGRQGAASPTGVLQDLARAAAEQPAPVPGTPPVALVATHRWGYDRARPEMVTTVVEHYRPATGGLVVVERTGLPVAPDGQVAATSPESLPITRRFEPGPDPGPDPATLPTDPGELLTALADPARCPQPGACLAQAMVDLHSSYLLPPALAAALWTALDGTAQLYGQTTDRLGRPVVGLQVPGTTAGQQLLLYADPATGALRGADLLLTEDDPQRGLAAPAVIGVTVIVRAERVGLDQVP
ncbi:MAG: twin-arginine translocation signal domain-containing protein [Actinomycetia bacterium]|nr:twin-arginine translocation signal domain-containing protein [Actinomycetes bacterium]